MKKRPSPLQPSSDDVRDASSGPEHEPSLPPTPKPKKYNAKKPAAPAAYDTSSRPPKKGKPTNSQPQPAHPPLEGDEREESDAQGTLPRPAAKKKPPAPRKEKATQPKVSTTTTPPLEKKPKIPTEHAHPVAPTKPKKKVNLGGGRGLLGGFGGLGGIGASSINWGREIEGSDAYGIPLTLSSPIKGGRDEAVKASQGSMFTFGANK